MSSDPRETHGESQGDGREVKEREEKAEKETEDWYRAAAVDCFRYLGFTSLDQVDRLTPYEYELLMEGYRLRTVDDELRLHQAAWLGHQVRAKKKVGKDKLQFVFTRFEQFFDYKKALKKAAGGSADTTEGDRFDGLRRYLKGK